MIYQYTATSRVIYLLLLAIIVFAIDCNNNKETTSISSNWCDKEIRPALKKLTAIKTKREWFKVYQVGTNVYAIVEPYNFQEVISYLIMGKEKALLFDTGMGLDSISLLVKELTQLPVVVINSHTHYDHIGGNNEFEAVYAMNTDYTRKSATNGWAHDIVNRKFRRMHFVWQSCQKQIPPITA